MVPPAVINRWRQSLALGQAPGKRCLLDLDWVAEAVRFVGAGLVQHGFLSADSVAIQVIAFDKSEQTNWKVPWHQDLMFPLARPAQAPGYAQSSVKDGVHFSRPPVGILEELVAARVHLDDCGSDRGPLRVVPGTHRAGFVPSESISGQVIRSGEVSCVAKAGDVLLLRPLLLHASSKATTPGHRRVLHLVYHAGRPPKEPWHRAMPLPGESSVAGPSR